MDPQVPDEQPQADAGMPPMPEQAPAAPADGTLSVKHPTEPQLITPTEGSNKPELASVVTDAPSMDTVNTPGPVETAPVPSAPEAAAPPPMPNPVPLPTPPSPPTPFGQAPPSPGKPPVSPFGPPPSV